MVFELFFYSVLLRDSASQEFPSPQSMRHRPRDRGGKFSLFAWLLLFHISLENNPKQIRALIGLKLCFYLTKRFHAAVRLFSKRSQMTSKCGKNKKVAHEAIGECVTDVPTTFWRPPVMYYWTDARQHGKYLFYTTNKHTTSAFLFQNLECRPLLTLANTKKSQMNKRWKFLNKLWCCVGGGNNVIWLYQLSWKFKLATVTSYKADVSSVSPWSEPLIIRSDEVLTLETLAL